MEPQNKPNNDQDCLSPLLLYLVLIWIMTVSFTRHLITFFYSVDPGPTNTTALLLGAAIQFFLVAIPLFPLAIYWRSSRYRASFQTLALASLPLLLFLPAGFTAMTASQIQALIQISLVWVYIAILVAITWRRIAHEPGSSSFVDQHRTSYAYRSSGLMLIVITMAAFFIYPWLSRGAFGSLLDTLLQLTLGFSLGLAAALLLELYLFFPQRQEGVSQSVLAATLNNSAVASVVLIMFGSSLIYIFSAIQLILMITCAAAGLLITSIHLVYKQDNLELARKPLTWLFLPSAFLIGILFSAPLVFIDSDELALILNASPGEILGFAFQAAFITMLATFVTGIIFAVLTILRGAPSPSEFEPPRLRRWIYLPLILAAGLSWAAAGMHYKNSGQPGWYGERIFVILKSQADLSQAESIQDYNERRRFAYQVLVEHADFTQRDIRNTLESLGLDYTPYYLVNAIELPDNPILRLYLSFHPDVDRVLNSPRLRPLPEPQPETQGYGYTPTKPEWNLTMIHADRVWTELGITGQGIVIGHSDSGVQGDHPEVAIHIGERTGITTTTG